MPVQAIAVFTRGETWLMDVTLNDSSGAPLSLTGLTGAAIQFKLSNGLTAAIGSGITVTNAALGQVQIAITPAMQTTVAITDGIYDYEIRITLANGVVSTQLSGKFTVLSSVF
jgi:hypothetical protein